jgi:hypoxanthine phosphoribosyltransferase
MQASQVRHKNRKLRRLRELYPDVNVKLFKRNDIRALLVKFGVEDFSTMMENEL